MTRIVIARGKEVLRIPGERSCGSGSLFIVGPISKIFLLYEDTLREILERCGQPLVIPSSYDDVAVYVNMKKLGYRICRGPMDHDGIKIHCLERGEKPWAKMLLRQERALTLFFTEDPDPMDLEDLGAYTTSSIGGCIIYISYGVSQPSGVIIGRWISLRINPSEDLLALIDATNSSLTIDLEVRKYRLRLTLQKT